MPPWMETIPPLEIPRIVAFDEIVLPIIDSVRLTCMT